MKNKENLKFRFKEFTDEWQRIRLVETKDVRDGTHDSPKYYSEGFPLVTSKNLKEYGLDMTDVSLISEQDFHSINKRSKVDIGDIIFGMIGTIGNPVIIDRDDFAIKNVALIKRGGGVANEFLIHLLKSPVFNKYIQNENVGNTQKFLGLNKIRDFHFSAPSNEEQEKIGGLFKKLDDIIMLQQQELDTLKQTKQGFLQKMFPKEGESVQKLRFPGFSGDWKKCRLADETKIIAGGDVDKSKLSTTGRYPVLANALTNDGIVGYYENEYRIEAPAVTVTGRGDVGHAKARRIGFTPVVRLLAIKSEHDVDFLENAINNHKIVIESTGVPQLTSPQLGNYQIYFPSFNEQKRIGEFFRKINNIIALQQQELDALKQTKKAFLQKMFV